MNNIELLLISIGLAMDAFSVSICKGLTMKHKWRRMPLIGYFLGSNLGEYFISFNHIIAFCLLTIIGINMIKESYKNEDIKIGLSIKELLMLSIATSIDAMAVGITLSFFEVNLVFAILLIGITAFIFSLIGVNIGKFIGKNFEKKAQIIGGTVLILIGIKILLEHFDIF